VPPTNDEIARLAQVLNSMLDRLERSFHQATRFSADASHELKTPLTILRNMVEELLESPTVRGDDQRQAQVLLEQTLRLSSITESLLLLSRADTGQLRIDLAPTDICQIIEGVTEDAGAMAQDREIQIETKLPEELPGLADAGRLSQILLNLLENAVKYNHPGGRITISAGHEEDGRIFIRVANTGPAIPPEKSELIFNRFFRITGNEAVEGHGLGLSIARELARAHGGDLTLERSDSQWTEFLVRLAAVPPGESGRNPSPTLHPSNASTIP
jgi:signal transduction histidine kinase